MADKILIIESEPSLARELVVAFTEAGFAVADVPDYPQALGKLDSFKPDTIVMDAVLPSRDGIEACSELHDTFGIPVVLLGEDSTDETWERVTEAGADLYQVKPCGYRSLVARVKAILRRYRRSALRRGYSEYGRGS